MGSERGRDIVVALVALERLRVAVINRGLSYARISRLLVPVVGVPVLHLRCTRVMVHVQLTLDGPDLFVWGGGYFRHPVRDVWGAAARLLGDARTRAKT